jgi:FecR protein
MKHIQALTLMALCGVALMFANTVFAQSTKQGIATVVRIQGEARYSVGDNVWHPLIAGKTLGAGAVIQTAVDSTVDLVLGTVPVQVSYPTSTEPPAGPSSAADPNVRGYVVYNPKVSQNVIRMFGNTVMAVDKLTVSNTGVDAVGDTELDLRAGKIFGTVTKISAMSQFEIKIPNGVAGIRGTTFMLSADGSCSVLKGSVVLSVVGSNGSTVTEEIGAGQQFNPQQGNPTTLTPSDLSFLGQISNVVPTFFPENKQFVGDFTKCYVSPVVK